MPNRKLVAIEACKFFLPTVALLLVVALLAHNYRRNLRQIIAVQERAVTQSRAILLAEELHRRISDARILASTTERHLNHDGRLDGLHLDFEAIAAIDPLYAQVRLISPDGRELIRFNRAVHGQPVKVPEHELQDKSRSPHFQATAALAEGIYVSPLSLNEEHGAMEEPHRPMIHIGTPVRHDGELLGVVMLTIEGQLLLDPLITVSEITPGHVYLVNGDGYWLLGPTPESAWGFQLPERRDQGLRQQAPEAWERLRENPRGQFPCDLGMITYETAWPADKHWSIPVITADRWIVVSQVVPGDLLPPWWSAIRWGAGAVLLLLAVGSWHLGKAQAQQRLDARQRHQAERRFQAIFNNTYQFTGLLTPDGTVLEANKTALSFGGFSRERVVGKPFWEAPWWDVSEAVRSHLKQAIRQAAAGDFVRYEVDVRSYTGGLEPIDFSLRPMLDDAGKVVLLIPEGRVISELKAERTALRQSRQLFANAFDYAPIGMALLEPDGAWIQVNAALCDIVGYTHDELLQTTFQAITHPDDLDTDLDNVRKVLAREIDTYTMEKRYIRKDGSPVWVQLTVSMVWKQDNSPRYFIAQIQDITAAKALREKLLQANQELDRSNRDLAQFAYVASHDLQEPLRMVSSFVSLIDENVRESADAETRRYIQYAVDGSERMQQLIQDLLDYSRVNTRDRKLQKTDLNELVSIACADLYAAIEDAGGEVQTAPLGEAMVDAGMFKQIFQNLIANAIKFRRDGVPPVIRIGAERHDSHLTLHVADNGIGIEERHQDKIFQVFKRLNRREDYRGTGIGLAICKRVVERHDGRIRLESTPGEGTTFYIEIPTNKL